MLMMAMIMLIVIIMMMVMIRDRDTHDDYDDAFKSDLLRILVGEMPSTSDSFLTSWQNWTLIRVGLVIGAMSSVVI